MRVIAESFRKSDKLDAQVLAEFLADGRILASYRPTPRQRDHRRLVRHRVVVQREKEGSKLLRWVLVEAAWRLRRHSARWSTIYEELRIELHSKKTAIVAIARRLPCLMKAILDSGRPYDTRYVPEGSGHTRATWPGPRLRARIERLSAAIP